MFMVCSRCGNMRLFDLRCGTMEMDVAMGFFVMSSKKISRKYEGCA